MPYKGWMADGFDKSEVALREVVVRPVRADERRRWDREMAEHHYLGFKQFAGRGLRHVAEWRGHWLALVGWQSGAFKCAPRDDWLGWHPSVQFRRLHLIGNNTRFLILPKGEGIKNLASRTLGLSLRRLSGDWREAHGHVLELAETFVDPSRFKGTCHRASNWERVGVTKGFARHNGAYTDAHAPPKEMRVRPLRPDARRRLSDPTERPEWGAPKAVAMPYGKAEPRSLRDVFAELPDCRRGQGRKHRLETVLAIVALAKLSGLSGPAAAERFGRGLAQEELRALGGAAGAGGGRRRGGRRGRPRHGAPRRRHRRRGPPVPDQEELPRNPQGAGRHGLGRRRREAPRRAAGEGPRQARNPLHLRRRPAEEDAALPTRPPSVPRRPRARRDQDRRGVPGRRLRHLLGRRGPGRPRAAAGLEPRPLDDRERQPPPQRRHPPRGRQPGPRHATRRPTMPP